VAVEESDLEGLLGGNEAATKRFFEGVRSLTVGIARRHYRFTGDEAEETAAEVQAKLWSDDRLALRRWRGECPLSTYLAVVANRFCLMRKRRQARSPETAFEVEPDSTPAPPAADTVDLARRWDACRDALSTLPERDRAIVSMRYLEDLEYDEISGRLGISHGAARKALHDALARLRAALRWRAPGLFP
jgi:RNA polymerase sigma factor (sigma-70 family)